MHDIRRGDKENFRQVVFNVQVMVLEHVILFRVEHFQQGRARVAAEICAEFVYFIKQQHGIDRAGFLHHLNDLTGQRADVGAAMSSNLGFVTHAAQRQAHKLSARSASDRFSQTRLANSRRADKTENRAARVLHQLTHGKVFENAVLDLVQTEMVFVENFFSLGEIS